MVIEGLGAPPPPYICLHCVVVLDAPWKTLRLVTLAAFARVGVIPSSTGGSSAAPPRPPAPVRLLRLFERTGCGNEPGLSRGTTRAAGDGASALAAISARRSPGYARGCRLCRGREQGQWAGREKAEVAQTLHARQCRMRVECRACA